MPNVNIAMLDKNCRLVAVIEIHHLYSKSLVFIEFVLSIKNKDSQINKVPFPTIVEQILVYMGFNKLIRQ